MPLVYTPTVGEACQMFGHILRRPRGLYLSINRRGRLTELLRNWPQKDIRFAVVTDGERILGLGDLGVNGMGIPVGKLALYYTALRRRAARGHAAHHSGCGYQQRNAAGRSTLPRAASASGAGERVRRLPRRVRDGHAGSLPALLHPVRGLSRIFHAVPLLSRYRDRVCCYNDDIQGTAAVAVAGISAALRILEKGWKDQTLLFPRRRLRGSWHCRVDQPGHDERRPRDG